MSKTVKQHSEAKLSEAQIVFFASIMIIALTVLCMFSPPAGDYLRKALFWLGSFFFGIPYIILVLYVVKEAVNDLLMAIGSSLKIDTDELFKDLRDIFFVDKVNKKIGIEPKNKKAQSDDDLDAFMMFEDEDFK